MGLLAGAVTVITTGIGDTRRGLTATAVCSLSVEPPMILVCANRSGEAREMIWRSGFFCVNVLSGDDQDVANGFAGRSGLSGSEKFTVGDWGTIATGIDCELSEKLESHTHTTPCYLARSPGSLSTPRPMTAHPGSLWSTGTDVPGNHEPVSDTVRSRAGAGMAARARPENSGLNGRPVQQKAEVLQVVAEIIQLVELRGYLPGDSSDVQELPQVLRADVSNVEEAAFPNAKYNLMSPLVGQGYRKLR
jgi:hypothetical protein